MIIKRSQKDPTFNLPGGSPWRKIDDEDKKFRQMF